MIHFSSFVDNDSSKTTLEVINWTRKCTLSKTSVSENISNQKCSIVRVR